MLNITADLTDFAAKVEEAREVYGPAIDAMPEEAKGLGLHVLNMALDEGASPEEAVEAGAGAIGLMCLSQTGNEGFASIASRVGFAFLIITLGEIALEVVEEAGSEVVAEAERITASAL